MPRENFTVVLDLPVLWGDQDLLGHVNNTIHFKWFESARVRYWEESGLRTIMESRNWGPILASTSCDYLKQINYPDQIQTAVRVVELRRTSMLMQHQIFSTKTDAVAARGTSAIVLFDYSEQTPQPIEGEMRSMIALFEGRSFDD